MDRDFRNPEDVARATAEQVRQSLAKILRRGVSAKSFCMRLKFEFSGGRAEPVLFIGNLNRAWRDYINANARALDMIVGTCSTGRGDTGRTQIRLQVERGRGVSDSTLASLNRVLREINAEAVFAAGDDAARPTSPAPSSRIVLPTPATKDADAQALSAGQPAAGAASGDDEPLDLEAEAQRLKELFAAFKAAPSLEKLEELMQLIAAWEEAAKDDQLMLISQESEFVEKLRKLLEAKGAQFVEQRSG